MGGRIRAKCRSPAMPRRHVLARTRNKRVGPNEGRKSDDVGPSGCRRPSDGRSRRGGVRHATDQQPLFLDALWHPSARGHTNVSPLRMIDTSPRFLATGDGRQPGLRSTLGDRTGLGGPVNRFPGRVSCNGSEPAGKELIIPLQRRPRSTRWELIIPHSRRGVVPPNLDINGVIFPMMQ